MDIKWIDMAIPWAMLKKFQEFTVFFRTKFAVSPSCAAGFCSPMSS